MQDLPKPFDQLPETALRFVDAQQNELLFRQGDRTKGMYLLDSGAVELRRVTEAGDRLPIHQARSGETFAEASLFMERYHCDAVVIAPSRIVRFDKRMLLHAFERDPAFALEMASRFAHQVQAYRRRLEILAIRGAEQRVLNAVRDGMLKADISSFAAAIGLTREATYRALAALAGKGRLVKRGRGQYILP